VLTTVFENEPLNVTIYAKIHFPPNIETDAMDDKLTIGWT